MTVVEAYNRTALSLYPDLMEEGEDLVLSPFSIGMAMAMTQAGARGDTAAEMARVLHLPSDVGQTTEGNSQLMERLAMLNSREGVVLNVANALALAEHGDMIHDSYKTLLQKHYDAELFKADSVDPINRWVAEKTRNMIEQLINAFPPNAVCVILNAVYFNGAWQHPFDEDATQPRPFHLSREKSEPVPTMEQTERLRLAKFDDMNVLALPYEHRDLRLLLLVPRDIEGLAAIERKLDHRLYSDVVAKIADAEMRRVRLRLPKYKVETEASLSAPFKGLGMKRAFSGKDADFAGMMGKEEAPGMIWIHDILHKAVIDVSETGTEAAAATGVIMATRAAPKSEPVELDVDRPFLYLLTDRQTDAILFMGRVLDPR
ncbi:MAG: serpin family protein [Verrucomicrobiota bacterium]